MRWQSQTYSRIGRLWIGENIILRVAAPAARQVRRAKLSKHVAERRVLANHSALILKLKIDLDYRSHQHNQTRPQDNRLVTKVQQLFWHIWNSSYGLFIQASNLVFVCELERDCWWEWCSEIGWMSYWGCQDGVTIGRILVTFSLSMGHCQGLCLVRRIGVVLQIIDCFVSQWLLSLTLESDFGWDWVPSRGRIRQPKRMQVRTMQPVIKIAYSHPSFVISLRNKVYGWKIDTNWSPSIFKQFFTTLPP